MMRINLIFLFALFISTIKAQEKKFKNDILYKQDSTIYNYKPLKSNLRTKFCKKILVNDNNKNLSNSIDWKVEKEILLENKDLITIKNIFFTRKEGDKESLDFLFESTRDTFLGPYASAYGSFRFIKINYNTSKLKSSWGLTGDGLDYSWILLSNKKGSPNQLRRIAQRLINFYNTGRGNYNCIEKKIKQFQEIEKGGIDFVDSSKNKRIMKELLSGKHYLTLEHPRGLAVLGVEKRASGYESVRYTEYIFK